MNANQITYNVDRTVIESMNVVDHVVLIKVFNLGNHVDYRVKLSDILIIVLSKTTIGNVDLVVSSVIDHTTHLETVVSVVALHFDVPTQPIIGSVEINLVNYMDVIVPTKFVVTSTETMIEHIVNVEILVGLRVLYEVMIDNTALDGSLGKTIVSPNTIVEYVRPIGSVENVSHVLVVLTKKRMLSFCLLFKLNPLLLLLLTLFPKMLPRVLYIILCLLCHFLIMMLLEQMCKI